MTDPARSTVGVYTRNHPVYLKRATLRAGRRVVFRSKLHWAGAADLLRHHDEVLVFVAPVDGGQNITYAGRLHQVVLDPTLADLAALIADGVVDPTTTGEGIWGGDCKTMSVVELEELSEPFPMTQLVKLSDGQPLSADYGYGYSLVRGPELPLGRPSAGVGTPAG